LEGLIDANAAVRGLHGKNVQGKTAVRLAESRSMSTTIRTGGGGRLCGRCGMVELLSGKMGPTDDVAVVLETGNKFGQTGT
jgi:hypothetical protein